MKSLALLVGIIASVVGIAKAAVEISQILNPPAPVATVSPPAASSASERPVTIKLLSGSWRATKASEGDLASLTIVEVTSSSATISGTYTGKGGYQQLAERRASFADGVLSSTDIWILGTTVDHYRLKTARLMADGLHIEFEHCVVGQLGISCTSRDNLLVR